MKKIVRILLLLLECYGACGIELRLPGVCVGYVIGRLSGPSCGHVDNHLNSSPWLFIILDTIIIPNVSLPGPWAHMGYGYTYIACICILWPSGYIY